jgi:hypothetical protein
VDAARRAGSQHANNATSVSSKGEIRNVRGSVELTAKSRLFTHCVKANAAGKPMQMPIRINLIPSPTTSVIRSRP